MWEWLRNALQAGAPFFSTHNAAGSFWLPMLDSPYSIVVPASLLLGVAAGYVMHRSDFCVAGMFRDLFLFRQTYMLSMLLLLIGASMVLFQLGALVGLVPLEPFPLLGPPAMINLLGGAIFGFGMVLGGGCVVGTLYKLGAGSSVSLAALVGMVGGSALYAEIHPWWSALAQESRLTDQWVTLPQAMGTPPLPVLSICVLVVTAVLYVRFRRRPWSRHSPAQGHLQPWVAALVLAVIGFLSYTLVGMPLGITTAYAKLGAYIETLFSPGHVADLAYFRAQSLDYVPPLAPYSVQGGAGPRLDAIAAIQFPLIIGIVLGGAFSALLVRELRFYFRIPLRQYLAGLSGGLIMGLAARMTPACNVWHLFGGLPILAMQSLLFLVGLFPGAWLGSRVLARLVLSQGAYR